MDRPDWFCRLFGAEVLRADESKETNVSVTWHRRTPRPLTCQTHLPPGPAPRCSPGTRPSCSQNTREGRSPAAGHAGWWAWCCRACRSCDSRRCTSGKPCVWCSDTGAGCRGPSTGRTAATAQSGPRRDRSTAAWPDDLADRRLGPQQLQTDGRGTNRSMKPVLSKAFLNNWSTFKKNVYSNGEGEPGGTRLQHRRLSWFSRLTGGLTFGVEVWQNQSQEESSGLRHSRPPRPQRLHESSSQRTWRSEAVAPASNHFWFQLRSVYKPTFGGQFHFQRTRYWGVCRTGTDVCQAKAAEAVPALHLKTPVEVRMSCHQCERIGGRKMVRKERWL